MRPYRKQRAEKRGRRAEFFAALWLRLHGWTILAKRIRTPVGEVDLIARRRHRLAFIEVKARRSSASLDHAIDRNRLRRVAAAAEMLSQTYARAGDSIEIDVMLLAPWQVPRHLANVWHG